MKSTAVLQFEVNDTKKLLTLLSSEDYDFNNKQINLQISEVELGVQVTIQASTPQLLKIATTAVCDSCEVIRKTQQTIQQR